MAFFNSFGSGMVKNVRLGMYELVSTNARLSQQKPSDLRIIYRVYRIRSYHDRHPGHRLPARLAVLALVTFGIFGLRL